MSAASPSPSSDFFNFLELYYKKHSEEIPKEYNSTIEIMKKDDNYSQFISSIQEADKSHEKVDSAIRKAFDLLGRINLSLFNKIKPGLLDRMLEAVVVIFPQDESSKIARAKVASAILTAGASVKTATDFGPLMFRACQLGDLILVKALKERGVDINALGYPRGGSSPIEEAAYQKAVAIVEYLLKEGAKVNDPKKLKEILASRGNIPASELTRLNALIDQHVKSSNS